MRNTWAAPHIASECKERVITERLGFENEGALGARRTHAGTGRE
jgi:hypothetical protein